MSHVLRSSSDVEGVPKPTPKRRWSMLSAFSYRSKSSVAKAAARAKAAEAAKGSGGGGAGKGDDLREPSSPRQKARNMAAQLEG